MKNTGKAVALLLVVVMALGLFAGCKKQAKVGSITELSETFGDELYGIGFRNGDVALGLKVQEAFDAIQANGEAAKISKTWFGSDDILKDQPFVEETEAAATDESWKKIQERGYFTVGLDASFPPMGYLNDKNEIVGFDIDLAKAVAKELGVEVKFQPIDWAAKEMELNNGNIDCIWNGMTMTDERIQNMYFSKPYLANEQIILTADNSGITSKATLKGKTVGTQSGSSALDAIEADPSLKATFKELVTYDEYTVAYQDLKVGRIDALVIDSVVGRYLVATDAK